MNVPNMQVPPCLLSWSSDQGVRQVFKGCSPCWEAQGSSPGLAEPSGYSSGWRVCGRAYQWL